MDNRHFRVSGEKLPANGVPGWGCCVSQGKIPVSGHAMKVDDAGQREIYD